MSKFAVSFRINIGVLSGQRVFLNGSAFATAPVPAGTRVVVQEKDATLPDDAEVIESSRTSREAYSFRWDVV